MLWLVSGAGAAYNLMSGFGAGGDGDGDGGRGRGGGGSMVALVVW